MKEVIWLTVSRQQVVNMTKNPPRLKQGEIPVKIWVEVDAAVFGAPVLEQRVRITDWREGLAFPDVDLKDMVITEAEAGLIRSQRLGSMMMALQARGYQVTAPPEDDDD